MPRCWAHSPTAMTPARLVRIESSTMIPRSQTIPIERELGLRPDADRHDDEVGEQLRAVGEAQAMGAIGADDLLGVAVELDVDVQAAQGGSEQGAGAGVELALHEAVEQVHDGDRGALRGDPARRLEAEQAAADDGRALDPLGRGEADGVAVGGVAEGMHAGEVDARDRGHERLQPVARTSWS